MAHARRAPPAADGPGHRPGPRRRVPLAAARAARGGSHRRSPPPTSARRVRPHRRAGSRRDPAPRSSARPARAAPGPSSSAHRRGGQGDGEGGRAADCIKALRLRAHPHHDVVGRDAAGQTVVGLARRVAAAGRLEVHVGHGAPADAEADFAARTADQVPLRVLDHVREHDGADQAYGDRLRGRGGSRRGVLPVRPVIVHMGHDEPGRREGENRDVTPDGFLVERRLRVDQEGGHGFAGERDVHHVGDQFRVVARTPQLIVQFGCRSSHLVSLPSRAANRGTRPRTALRGTSCGRPAAVWRAWHQSPREPARMGAPAPDPGLPVPIDLGAPALMARQKTPAPEAADIAETIVDIDVSREMEGSFLEYAYSVIYARALPDARDGLKPVQRPILYQMADMGLRPDRGHVKSARVVGEVMGKLHPHGDTAIYDALVRLAQPFSLRLPLVDGHGNFGSLDDGPAAARYTEARLAASAMTMTAGLDEDVVDFVPNYDNKLTQPEVLPAAIPNLLVNGTTGIAVGMATNMAPHNLIEVISAARHLLANPKATLEDLMRFVPGPDLPTGGKIVGLDGIRDAYRTGRGSFRTRASARIENVSSRRTGIVITELPYLIGPEKVIEKIKEGVQSKKLSGISAVTDLTDRAHGLRLVVEIKNGFNAEAVLEQVYRHTPLEESFGINNVALVDGEPRTLGLRELLQVWVDHRLTVTRRRSQYRLTRRTERLHLVDGLLLAIVDIDEVIQLIRSSDDADTARIRLIEVFDLSQVQAEYILELRLRRLTKFSRIELEKEQDDLRREITALEEILGDEARLRAVVTAEMAEVAQQFGTPRRTILLESAGAAGCRT